MLLLLCPGFGLPPFRSLQQSHPRHVASCPPGHFPTLETSLLFPKVVTSPCDLPGSHAPFPPPPATQVTPALSRLMGRVPAARASPLAAKEFFCPAPLTL